MTAVNESNIGLYLGWTYGEDNWNTGMDNNMSIIGGMAQLCVKSRSTTVKPVSPTNGDRYYVPVGATGDWSAYEKNIAIYSGFHTAWKYVPAKLGFEFRVEDEANASFYYDGSALVSSVSLAGYLTASSVYTASGLVTFSTVPKISGSHSVDTTEVATVGDINTAIAAQNFSTFVRTTGSQSIAGVKTFTSPISGVDGVASSDLATLSQLTTAAAATTGANVGGGAEVFKAKSGDNIQMRTIIAGSNVTVTENTNDITISAAGGSFDATANQTITGEWVFDISGSKSWYVTDDPNLEVPTSYIGIFDHVASNTASISGISAINTTGDNSGTYQVYLDDDGSVLRYFYVSNAAGEAMDYTIVNIDGVSERSLTVDKLTVTTLDGTNNGVNYVVGTNTTFIIKDGHVSLGDYISAEAGVSGVVAPNFILNQNISGGANAKFGIGTSTVYGLEVTRDSGNLITEKLYTPNGKIEISQDTDGTAANIVLQANGTGVVSVVNPIKNTGNKIGTLASPPTGLVIGEIWADTTGGGANVTHPMLRISTVTT